MQSYTAIQRSNVREGLRDNSAHSLAAAASSMHGEFLNGNKIVSLCHTEFNYMLLHEVKYLGSNASSSQSVSGVQIFLRFERIYRMVSGDSLLVSMSSSSLI